MLMETLVDVGFVDADFADRHVRICVRPKSVDATLSSYFFGIQIQGSHLARFEYPNSL